MKRIITILSVALLTTTSWTQSPKKMSYQAVIRNGNDALVTNTQIGMQISILQGSTSGTSVYVETQIPITNTNGLVSFEIGSENATVVSGNLSTIDWSAGPYFIKTETDLDGGTSYTISGTSQLLSVPYALHAQTAESINGTINETDPVYLASVANAITATDTANWNNKLGSYIETQTISDVAALSNSVNTQLKNITDPTDAQDAATKAYVDALEQQIEVMQNTLINVGSIVKDYDGNIYGTTTIGTQKWMTENLKTTLYNDGTSIPLVTNGWKNLTTPGYCWYKNDSASYAQKYGALYNWQTVETGKLCPTDWHVPSDDEWTTLIDYLGGKSVAGGKLKETDTSHWKSPNAGAVNEYGFTALPGAYQGHTGGFSGLRYDGYWWSSTVYSSTGAWYRHMGCVVSEVYRGAEGKNSGFSVRCVRD